VRQKVGKRVGALLQVGEEVEFTIQMPVGGEDVLDVKAVAVGVTFGLLHAFEWVFAFLFGLQHCNGHGFGHVAHLHAQQVVGSSWTFATATFGATGLNGGLGQDGFERDVFAVDIAFGAQLGVDQVIAGVRFIHAHRGSLCVLAAVSGFGD